MERYALQKQKDDEALVVAQRRLREAEEASRVERAAFEKILENAKVLAQAEGRDEAEKAAAEAAKKAAEDAEIAKKEVVEEAVTAFVAEGWKAEAQKPWLTAVVEASVKEWVRGPGAMWLAQKGKEYYDGVSTSLKPSSTGGWPGTWEQTRRHLTRRLTGSPLFSQTPEFPSPRALAGQISRTPS
ncbi:unnamed protein product [Cuscuta europaea]|nr:unnamed protein product [Cuscuta europaea]